MTEAKQLPLQVPPIFLPFLNETRPGFDPENPENDPVETSTRAFIDRFHLYDSEVQRQRLRVMWSGGLTARMYPRGRDDLRQVGSDFIAWAFAFDDEYCDEGAYSRDPAKLIQAAMEIQRSVESPEHAPSSDRYVLAMGDIRGRLDTLAPPEQVGRFVEGIRTYMMIEMWKAVNHRPSLNDYVLMRMHGGGALAFPVLVHIIAGVEISQNEYENRSIRALTELASLIFPMDNDPLAYTKEMDRSLDREHNLLMVVRREKNYTVEQAVDYFLELRARLVSLFVRIKEATLRTASPTVREYIEGLELYTSGAFMWSRTCPRYASVSGLEPSGAFRGADPVFAAPEESFGPPGLASIDWWWQYDPAGCAATPAAGGHGRVGGPIETARRLDSTSPPDHTIAEDFR